MPRGMTCNRSLPERIRAQVPRSARQWLSAGRRHAMPQDARHRNDGGWQMTRQKGGDYIAETLVREGIPYVFGVCGHGTVGLIDCLNDVKDEVPMISPR